ncbi:MAG: FtsQ-type POTRA domain-containing protein [Clostridia bacterium]|nr:FtsQ-type POTRA domain-containing protein [Clostridia bacterium]
MEKDEVAKRRAYRRKKARKKRVIIGFVLFLIIGLSVLIALSLTVLFPIKNVTFSGNKIYTEEQLEEGLQIKGKNFFTISEKKIVANGREKLPYVESVKIGRKFPDTVSVEVTEAKEFAVYNVKGGYYAVSKDGYVLSKKPSKPEGVVEIKTDLSKVKIGEKIDYSDGALEETIETLIDKLDKKKIKIDYIDLTSKTDITVGILDGRFKVMFGSKLNIERKIDHLCVMLGKISDGDKGTINLSSWSESDPTGILIKE